MRKYFSDKSPYLIGIARLFDFSGTINNNINNSLNNRTDQEALYSDFYAVGQDFRNSFNQFFPNNTHLK